MGTALFPNLTGFFLCLLFFFKQVLYAEECQAGARGDIRSHREVSGTSQAYEKHTYREVSPEIAAGLWMESFFTSCLPPLLSCCYCQPSFCCFPSCRYNSPPLFFPHSQNGSSLADLKLHISPINLQVPSGSAQNISRS